MISYILLVIFILLQIFDVWSTNRILSYGGVELNKIMAWIMSKFGVLPSLVITKSIICILAFLVVVKYSSTAIPISLAIINAWYVFILYKYNFRNII